MERLTERHYKKSDGYYIRCSEHCNNDICDCSCEKFEQIIDRLGAYEDTGLEPENIMRPFTEDVILKLAGAILGVSPDRLQELAQADRVPVETPYKAAWISVKDRLPTEERPVLTFIGYRGTGIGFISTSSYFCFDPSPHWQWDGLVQDDQRVLFWMPLPETPEEEQDG